MHDYNFNNHLLMVLALVSSYDHIMIGILKGSLITYQVVLITRTFVPQCASVKILCICAELNLRSCSCHLHFSVRCDRVDKPVSGFPVMTTCS